MADNNGVSIKVAKHSGTTKVDLIEIEELILNSLKLNQNLTKKEISEELKISVRTINRAIKKMKELKIIERVGSDKTGYWRINSKN